MTKKKARKNLKNSTFFNDLGLFVGNLISIPYLLSYVIRKESIFYTYYKLLASYACYKG